MAKSLLKVPKLKIKGVNTKKILTPRNLLIGGIILGVGGIVAWKAGYLGDIMDRVYGDGDGGDVANPAEDDAAEVYFEIEPVERHSVYLKGYFKNPASGQTQKVSQGYYYVTSDFNNRTILVSQGVLGTNISEFYQYIDMSGFPRGGYTFIVSSTAIPRDKLAASSIGESELGGMGIRGNLPRDMPGLSTDRPEFANVPVSPGGSDFKETYF